MGVVGPGGPPGVHSTGVRTPQPPGVSPRRAKGAGEGAFEMEPGSPEGLKLCSREEPAPFQPE